MDEFARRRLKAAIAASGKTAKSVSLNNGWPETYVSRVVSGKIQKPDPSRLYLICKDIGSDIGYILTGETMSQNRVNLLDDLAKAPDDIIEQVSKFVKSKGLSADQ